MNITRFLFVLAFVVHSTGAHAAPTTVAGDPFTLVATGPAGTQLFGLASDEAGRIYIGNNSNDPAGIPVQRFNPADFSGSPVALQAFGPPVGDADGIAFGGGFIYVPDRDEGLRRVAVAGGTSSIIAPGKALNAGGSPVVYRPTDGHIFVGAGTSVSGSPGGKRIDEYDDAGTFVQSFATGAEVETMTFDPGSGLIYYAPYGTEVRSLNPEDGTDRRVGESSGFIDGALALDSLSGLLYVGAANGSNAGIVETIDPATGERKLFASGFNGSLGILREPVSGDLYFLESQQLYRLDSTLVGSTPARLLNISTRLNVQTGDDVLIGGFIITGSEPTEVIIRGLGPSLTNVNAPLQDPTLELSGPDGTIATNDDWKDTQQSQIEATTIPPSDAAESAIVRTLQPGAYTAILRGKDNVTGVGLVEVYNLSRAANSKLANISTRGRVESGDNVMIAGFIVGEGNAGAQVVIRALGPSLGQTGIQPLPDPTLQLVDVNGTTLRSNDNWQQSQEAEIRESQIAPTEPLESALITRLAPGAYTAIVRDKGGNAGIGLVEVYNVE